MNTIEVSQTGLMNSFHEQSEWFIENQEYNTIVLPKLIDITHNDTPQKVSLEIQKSLTIALSNSVTFE